MENRCETCGTAYSDPQTVEYDQIRCDGGLKVNTVLKDGLPIGYQCRDCGAIWEDVPDEVRNLPRTRFSEKELLRIWEEFNEPFPDSFYISEGRLEGPCADGKVPDGCRSLNLTLYRQGGWGYADIVKTLSGFVVLDELGEEKVRDMVLAKIAKADIIFVAPLAADFGLEY